MSRPKRTIALDFDGVLHKYDGYRNGFIDGPIDGACQAVERLVATGQTVVVFTTRDAGIVKAWLIEHGFPLGLEVTREKKPFYVIVDDRAFCFTGVWSDAVVKQIQSFEPYWIQNRKTHGG